MPHRGEIWLANLNPRRGTEAGRTRPVLVVQAQSLLDANHPSTIVLPLTTSLVDDAAPLRVRLPAEGRRRASDVMVDQLRAIHNRRLVKGPVGKLSAGMLGKVDEALGEVVGLAR